ncbi:hypothetical protein [Methanocella arvoryzae]|uniref:hypothetical protein n=1 Tax=Methanocella arvoryzae TaxID=1175445 RepID=UPI0013050A08|nr:hypothetical protein [Methanocella arvoryzae]
MRTWKDGRFERYPEVREDLHCGSSWRRGRSERRSGSVERPERIGYMHAAMASAD